MSGHISLPVGSYPGTYKSSNTIVKSIAGLVSDHWRAWDNGDVTGPEDPQAIADAAGGYTILSGIRMVREIL
ncbi:hypothetical protein RRG08_065793 [Elysia crispata]|uniref:Uncharacterized protein n=1 Tax=Elysia crispata TaxID=231223 RepID=A0AAE1DKJ1_9GAST|nr:hypothetical protein RRG08_065793 [Elysia crispata]